MYWLLFFSSDQFLCFRDASANVVRCFLPGTPVAIFSPYHHVVCIQDRQTNYTISKTFCSVTVGQQGKVNSTNAFLPSNAQEEPRLVS